MLRMDSQPHPEATLAGHEVSEEGIGCAFPPCLPISHHLRTSPVPIPSFYIVD